MRRALAGAGLLGSLVLSLPGTAQAAGDWHQVKLPFLWPVSTVNDLAAPANDNVWVAGAQGAFCLFPGTPPWGWCRFSSRGNPVVRRWDGTRWMEYPIEGKTSDTHAMMQVKVHGSEVWIRDDGDYVGRFDGAAFQRVALPSSSDVQTLSATPAGIWLRQDAKTYRWTGAAWTETPPPAGLAGTYGQTGSAASGETWALGHQGNYPGSAHELVRWDGTRWHSEGRTPDLGVSAQPWDIESTGRGEVWVSFANTTDGTMLFRFKDGVWTDMTPAGGLTGDSSSLSVDGRGRIWQPQYGKAMVYDGTSWSERTYPAGIKYAGLTGVPGTDDLWAPGYDNGAAVFTDS